MRLFVAILLSPNMRNALLDAQREMRRQNVVGRYAPPENLHVTLAFIGEYPDPEPVLDALPGFAPFELQLEGLGAFGDLWWAGLRRSAPLEDCARRLRRTLSEAGIPFDRNRFSPHITLVRRAEGRPAVRVAPEGMTVRRVSLMRSDRGKSSMIYTEIGGVDAE